MKCFNCGIESNKYICDLCKSEEVLENIFNQLVSNFDKCDNLYIKEYAKTKENFSDIKECIPVILEDFDNSITDYFYCRYYKITKNSLFESKALDYLNSHNKLDLKKQRILYDWISFYLRDDYEKANMGCRLILNNNTSDIAVELYSITAEFYSIIAEYDFSEKLIKIGEEKLSSSNAIYLFSNYDNMIISFDKIKKALHRYKTKTPYWPTTRERREKLAKIYDEKKISYPRIDEKPKKINEEDFKPIKEKYDNLGNKYVCFWCSKIGNNSKVTCIYEIAAIRVIDNEIIETFNEYIKPWDGLVAKNNAAKKLGVELDFVEKMNDVDIVMKKFINFISDDVLVSTDALGNQAKLLIRALRYSGIDKLDNEIFDILDYAADVDIKFDFENNNRDYLLNYFNLVEGKNALEKAKINFLLVKKLKELGSDYNEFNR